MASLLCYEDNALQVHFPIILPIILQRAMLHSKGYESPMLSLQSVYRILVEILNENDNTPVFAEETVLSLFLSEV